MKVADAPVSRSLLAGLVVIVAGLAAAHAWLDSAAVGGITLAAALWRGLDAVRGQSAAPRWRVLLFGAAGVAVLLSEGAGDGTSAMAVRALIVLAGLKLLETRTTRDLYVVVYIAFFLVATLFLYDQGIALAVFGFAACAALFVMVVRVNTPVDAGDWRHQIRVVLRLAVPGLPVAVLLFLIFPRLPGPLWHFGLGGQAGISGLGDSMEPGSISQLVLSEDIAFRAEFDGKPPPRSDLYWRGPVLWHTDGRRWTRGDEVTASPEQLRIRGRTLSYRVVLEPHGQRWVLALDLPVRADRQTRLSADYELTAAKPVNERSVYHLVSVTGTPVSEISDQQRRAGLALPDGAGERTRELAAQLADGAPTHAGIVRAALDHFRREPFAYSLQPPALGDDPVDEFLFETRTGFCEHYASAFVVLMRMAGIPARVVTGYQGGEVNPHNDQLLVRQSDAHAWAEVWVETSGWLRVDPTAAVAPQRIDLGLDIGATAAGRGVPIFGSAAGLWRQLARRAEWLADALDMAWYRNVVNFSDRRQRNLMQDIGLPMLGTVGSALALSAAIVVTLILTAAMVLRVHRRPAAEIRIYADYCRKLDRIGLGREPGEGPLDYLKKVRHRLADEEASTCARITEKYVGIRYGRHRSAADLEGLRQLVGGFRPRLPANTDD